VRVETAFVCRQLVRAPDARTALEHLEAAGAEVVECSEAAFSKLAYGERLEGIVAVVRQPSVELANLRLPPDPLVVVTEDVEKPGNLGAILRSADGAGADAVIASERGTDLFNPNVIRASVGTVFTVPVAAADGAEVRAWLGQRAIRLVAARVDADRLYTGVDLRGPVAIIVGSEAHGLSDAWGGSAVEAVRLPMLGAADSLNVGVAAAVLLYEARRQRGLPGSPNRAESPAATAEAG